MTKESSSKAKIWKLLVLVGESPVGEQYFQPWLFIDRTGEANAAKVKLLFWHTENPDLYDRPELHVKFVRQSDEISLTGKQLMEINSNHSQFIRLEHIDYDEG